MMRSPLLTILNSLPNQQPEGDSLDKNSTVIGYDRGIPDGPLELRTPPKRQRHDFRNYDGCSSTFRKFSTPSNQQTHVDPKSTGKQVAAVYVLAFCLSLFTLLTRLNLGSIRSDGQYECPIPGCSAVFEAALTLLHVRGAHKELLQPQRKIYCPVPGCRYEKPIDGSNYAKHFKSHFAHHRQPCPWGCPQFLARSTAAEQDRHKKACPMNPDKKEAPRGSKRTRNAVKKMLAEVLDTEEEDDEEWQRRTTSKPAQRAKTTKRSSRFTLSDTRPAKKRKC
jgi:hypothetical protein